MSVTITSADANDAIARLASSHDVDDAELSMINSDSHSSCSSIDGVACSSDDEDRQTPVTPTVELNDRQHARAVQRLEAIGKRMLECEGVPRRLPNKLADALRRMLIEPAPTLLQAMQLFAQKDGTSPIPLPPPPPSAPPRPQRQPKVLSSEDLEILDHELQSEIWRRVARTIEPTYEALVKPCSVSDANDIAHHDKYVSGVDGVSLVYGEVVFTSLARILALHWKNLAPGEGVFIDIGSGVGKGVFSAMMCHQFKKLIGVEILKGLHESAIQLLKRYEEEFQDRIPNESPSQPLSNSSASSHDSVTASASTSYSLPSPPLPSLPPPSIEFLHADFRDLDWSDADIVFVNSTWSEHILTITRMRHTLRHGNYADVRRWRHSSLFLSYFSLCVSFDTNLMTDLSKYSQRLKKDALLITFTKRIQSTHFRLLCQ